MACCWSLPPAATWPRWGAEREGVLAVGRKTPQQCTGFQRRCPFTTTPPPPLDPPPPGGGAAGAGRLAGLQGQEGSRAVALCRWQRAHRGGAPPVEPGCRGGRRDTGCAAAPKTVIFKSFPGWREGCPESRLQNASPCLSLALPHLQRAARRCTSPPWAATRRRPRCCCKRAPGPRRRMQATTHPCTWPRGERVGWARVGG